MKKHGTLIAALLALTVAIAAPIAYAQHQRMRGHGFGHGDMLLGHLAHAKAALGLTDDQVTQIETIFTDLRAQNAQYRESMHDGIHSIMQTLIANPNDTAAAQALIDQQTAAERAMKTNLLNATSKALNVLTPEQRTKLGTFLEERMARRAR